MSLIYLNAAGAALNDASVLQAQIGYLTQEQQMGGYQCADLHTTDWQALYQGIATLIKAKAHNIALQESASRGLINALLSIPWQPNDRVVISDFEYGANYVALSSLADRFALEIDVVPAFAGEMDVAAMLEAIRPNTRAILVTWIPSHNGVINAAQKLGQQLAGFDGYYVLDACQAVGQIPVDVNSLGCDFLCATGRKFLRGPRGTGFLYLSDKVLNQGLFPMATDHFASVLQSKREGKKGEFRRLRDDARRFELWEANWAARIGLKVAVSNLLEDPDSVFQRLKLLQQSLRDHLADLTSIEMMDTGSAQSAIVTFRHRNQSSEDVVASLLKRKIVTSLVSPDSGWLDMKRRKLKSLVRASIHVYNTDHHFQRFVQALETL